MIIGRSNRPGGMRGSKHGWLSRQMPPFKRYFPGWAWLTLSRYCLGAFLLLFPSTTWMECWPLLHNRMRTSQLQPLHPSLRAHQLQAPQAVQLINLELHHFQYLPYQISPCRHSSSEVPIFCVPCHPTQKKWDCSLSSSVSNHQNKRTHVDPQEVKARSDHSSAQGNENTSKLVLEAGLSFNQQQGQELSCPLPVQPGPTLILMMVLQQEVQGVPVIRPHLNQTCPGRMWLTLIWTQLLGTMSLAQTRMKWLYELPRRSIGRGYKLPVGSARQSLDWASTEKDWQ